MTDVRTANIARRLNLPPSYVLIHRVSTAGIGVLCQLECDGPFRAEVLRWVPGYGPAIDPALDGERTTTSGQSSSLARRKPSGPGKPVSSPGRRRYADRLAGRLELPEPTPQPDGLITLTELQPLGPRSPPGNPFVQLRPLAVPLRSGGREQALLPLACQLGLYMHGRTCPIVVVGSVRHRPFDQAATASLRGRPRGRLRGTISPRRNSSPPQTPHGSARAMAPARQTILAAQLPHSDFANSTSSGDSAKNSSGSSLHGSSALTNAWLSNAWLLSAAPRRPRLVPPARPLCRATASVPSPLHYSSSFSHASDNLWPRITKAADPLSGPRPGGDLAGLSRPVPVPSPDADPLHPGQPGKCGSSGCSCLVLPPMLGTPMPERRYGHCSPGSHCRSPRPSAPEPAEQLRTDSRLDARQGQPSGHLAGRTSQPTRPHT